MMTEASRPRSPAGLGARGRRFWRDTVGDFDLSDAELAVLVEACRTLDDLDRLADVVAALGPMVTGSAGQPVVNPALTEARGQRAILHRLVSALQLPDPENKPMPTAASTRGHKAAAARWQRKRKMTG
jgi:hypothetical protein